ncbi:MAG: hypothetical protein AB1589_28190 [Cyanobacteriota bacterium]
MTPERLDEIDQRLEAHAEAIAQLRNQQQTNTATVTDLQRVTSELLDIARLHQQALRVSQVNADRDRAVIVENQVEIRRIWEYLLSTRNNGNRH